MRIGLLAPPWVPVPPVRYGGTEQVVDDLARGLAALGHDVALFTIGESTCPVDRRWYYEWAVTPLGAAVPEAAHVLAGYEALKDVDVVHDHTVLGPLFAGRLPGLPPVVTTNHGPFTPDARRIFRETARTASIVAISHSQRALAPEVPVAAVIHHGVDLDRYGYGPGGGGFVMFVGRMSPDKGAARAIRVARRAGLPIVVISKMREEDELAYFAQEVEPLLGPDVELHVELPAPERIALMRRADAVLDPITWPEPFGLVMAEALACGTPVLAFPNGAAPEIVDHGVTGFLCADEDEMVEALTRLDEVDRRACRAAAEERFSQARMAADHVALYATVLGLAAAAPGTAAPR